MHLQAQCVGVVVAWAQEAMIVVIVVQFDMLYTVKSVHVNGDQSAQALYAQHMARSGLQSYLPHPAA